jgi:hypothetical protein
MAQMKELFRAYKVAHKYREQWYNIKWRAVMILASVLFITFVYWYLGQHYFYVIEEFQFVLSERLFYWFMIGALFGIISIGLIFEGEFLLGLHDISKELAEAEKNILSPKKAQKAKPSKKGRK